MVREPVIGIDLGTTNSVVATMQNGQPTVIKNRAGHTLTPSVVAVAPNGKRLVGVIAKRQAVTNAANTAYAVKRLIGRRFSNPQVQEALKVLPYQVSDGGHDDVRIPLASKLYSPPELSAMVLAELKADAEAYLGQPVRKAVITVPAYFNDGQRQATKDAGKIAGLDVLRIINEPTAAALAYGMSKQVEGRIAVFDLGGGTFDISVLQVSGGVFEVLATGGDTYLGGEDFDNRIIEWLAFGFAKENGADLREDKMALQRLKEAAEKAKCELSATREAEINLPFIFTPPNGKSALHLQRTLTREKLEELTKDLVERCIERTRLTLEEAGTTPREVKEVVLVGGMTRMPKVAAAVKELFGREPSKGVHPDEVVALGAALQAHALVEEAASVVLLDVTPQALGVAIAGGYARQLVAKNTTVPTSATELFATSKDFQTVVRIMVLQGESEVATDNELLGEFVLSGLRAARRGEVEIAVSFDISADGIVSATAKDTATGQRQSITVTASGGLTQDELKKIIEEQQDYMLEAHVDEQAKAKRHEVSGLILELEGILPALENLVKQAAVGPEVFAKAQGQIRKAQSASASGSLKEVVEAQDELTRTIAAVRGVVARLGTHA
jgi:molecular chaperone DnaK